MIQILSQTKLLDLLQSLQPSEAQASSSNAHRAVQQALGQVIEAVRQGKVHDEDSGNVEVKVENTEAPAKPDQDKEMEDPVASTSNKEVA